MGNVTDDQGVPLPGATILEQGTANGVTTDFDGNFSMEVADGATLEVSFVGYESQTQSVGARSNIDFQLDANTLLDEGVITALGLERKKDNDISSASVVKSDAIIRSGETGLLQGVAGKTSRKKLPDVSRVILNGFTSTGSVVKEGAMIDEAIGKAGNSSASNNVFKSSSKWAQIGNALKARYYLALGDYTQANKAAVDANFQNSSNDWSIKHSQANYGENLFWRF
jgi:hypothetical protein